MNDQSIEIRGYAIPFSQTRYIAAAGAVELIEPGAFDRTLCATTTVPLLCHSHDAPAIAMARLHADEYGLAFSALLDARRNWAALVAMTRCIAPLDQVSVDLIIEDKIVGRYGTNRLHRVTRAAAAHICITDAAAYGTATGVWPMHCDLADAPWRVRQMAADWERGCAMWNARRASALFSHY
jgi:phage head maturation protease